MGLPRKHILKKNKKLMKNNLLLSSPPLVTSKLCRWMLATGKERKKDRKCWACQVKLSSEASPLSGHSCPLCPSFGGPYLFSLSSSMSVRESNSSRMSKPDLDAEWGLKFANLKPPMWPEIRAEYLGRC